MACQLNMQMVKTSLSSNPTPNLLRDLDKLLSRLSLSILLLEMK